jgi:phenylalanyl-tRNA synthetase alpha chain
MQEYQKGSLHPLTILEQESYALFTKLGFEIANGPELETLWYNFDALNVPKDHPARDMQDTFYVKNDKEKVLRTHATNTTARTLERAAKEGLKEIASISIGKVFRNEATDATHEAQFHQVEMLYVGKDASLSMMIGVIEAFFSSFFESELVVRLRSSYFPFVEPGNEVDMQCFKCKGVGLIATGNSVATQDQAMLGVGCNVCKGTGWIEIGGAGMVNPKVLEASGINPSEYRGFAFGCGIDRMVMLKYGIDDVRLLYSGDLRVVNQF